MPLSEEEKSEMARLESEILEAEISQLEQQQDDEDVEEIPLSKVFTDFFGQGISGFTADELKALQKGETRSIQEQKEQFQQRRSPFIFNPREKDVRPFSERLAEEQKDLEKTRRRSPGVATGAALLGGAVSALGAGGPLASAGKVLGSIFSAGLGAASGFASGSGQLDDPRRLQAGALGSAFGLGGSFAASALGSGAKLVGRKVSEKTGKILSPQSRRDVEIADIDNVVRDLKANKNPGNLVDTDKMVASLQSRKNNLQLEDKLFKQEVKRLDTSSKFALAKQAAGEAIREKTLLPKATVAQVGRRIPASIEQAGSAFDVLSQRAAPGFGLATTPFLPEQSRFAQ